jgi:hypothetical protein
VWQELQNLIDEANQSLEESGTPSHEIMVIVLHREFNGGSIGITLAGGADYESKEITVRDTIHRDHIGNRVLKSCFYPVPSMAQRHYLG